MFQSFKATLSIFRFYYDNISPPSRLRPDKQLKFSPVNRISFSVQHFVGFSVRYLQYLPPSQFLPNMKALPEQLHNETINRPNRSKRLIYNFIIIRIRSSIIICHILVEEMVILVNVVEDLKNCIFCFSILRTKLGQALLSAIYKTLP